MTHLDAEDLRAVGKLQADIEDCLTDSPITVTVAKERSRAMLEMFAQKGYSITTPNKTNVAPLKRSAP